MTFISHKLVLQTIMGCASATVLFAMKTLVTVEKSA